MTRPSKKRLAEYRAMVRTDREGDIDPADLLAEIDALTALPVLRTCGGCRRFRLDTMLEAETLGWCMHEAAPKHDESSEVDAAEPPPGWCPLRSRS